MILNTSLWLFSMDLAHCSYTVVANVCDNCFRENGGKIKCLGEGCALVDKDIGRNK